MIASCRWERGPTRPGERPEQVGHERRGGERGETDRFEAASPGHRRKQGRHERHAHADADGRDEVEREVAPERALMRRWVEWRPDHHVPRSGPFGLRGELSGSALGPPSRSRFAPGRVGPPSSAWEVRPRPTVAAPAGLVPWPVRPGTRRLVRGLVMPRRIRFATVLANRRTGVQFVVRVSVLGPVGMCGFDRAWLPGNASRGRHWASLITWQKEVPGNRQSTLALAA